MPSSRKLLALSALLLLFACSKPSTPQCTQDGDCTSAQRCQNQQCTAINCTKDDDCRDQYECQNSACVAPTCPQKQQQDGCCQDDHCPEGNICKDNKCAPKPCTKNDDCTDPNKPKCLKQTCSPADACSGDEDCTAPKPKCDAGTCVPLPPRKIGEECSNQQPCDKGLLCYSDIGQRFCRETCDPYSAVCSAGTICKFLNANTGVCVPRNNGKREGEDCDAAPCEHSFICVGWQNDKSICTRPCKDKSQCAQSEICHSFGDVQTCVAKPFACGAGQPCPNKWKCQDEQCIPDQCPQTPCPASQICKLGQCTNPNCCTGDVCQNGYVCNNQNGQCTELKTRIPFCTDCLSSGKCALPNERCLQLSGADDKFCAPECTATKQCSDPLMICTVQDDKRWFCIPRVGTCQRDRCKDVTCPDGQLCQPKSKTCIKVNLGLCQPCEDDLQCGGPTDQCIKKDGAKTGFCARDCSGCAECPSGYLCEEVNGQKQCLPATGTCP